MSTSVSIQSEMAAAHGGITALGDAAGYLGAALGVAMVVPQIVRTLRNPSVPGVSALSWALTALSCLTWLLYGVRADEIPQIPGNVLMVSGAAVIVLAVPSSVRRPVRAVGFGLPALVLVGLAIVLPPTAIGFVGFGIGLVSTLPQTIRSLTRPAGDPSAVSVATWALQGISQASWLAYALVRHDLTVSISASVLLTTAIVLVISESRVRPQPAGPVDVVTNEPAGDRVASI